MISASRDGARDAEPFARRVRMSGIYKQILPYRATPRSLALRGMIPNSRSLLVAINEFHYPGSINRSARWYHIIVLSSILAKYQIDTTLKR